MTPAIRAAALPGLLWAMAFDEKGCGRLLEPDEGLPDLDAFGSGFLWLHVDLKTANLAPLIDAGRVGPRALAEAVFRPDEHQRVTVEDGHVGGVVADLARPGAKPDEAGRLHFVMGPRSLVSGRRGPAESPDATRASAEKGQPIASPVLLLETMVGYVVASMAATGQRLSDEVDGIEDRVLDGRVRDDRRRLGPIRRSAVRLHRQLLGLAAVFRRLEEDDAAERLHGPTVATAARLAQRLDALDRDVNALAERARLLQEEVAARVAEESNRQLYVLSVLSALFLPPTFLTGLFGMNVKGLPFADDPHGFPFVIGLCLLSAATTYAIIRALGIRPPRG
ncbi:magnesium transporter/zinc transporter [Methylobacterium sp. BE186]|uniref:CorA family divalent cation transporter n=1 Tax=Methylobacterium sp. BE186 TaxID=2817715 RepID=UPI00285BB99A|nr:CorA family divalent cation transporter [Methylobacterium sp. BE186]MDR7036500.1 magnesium transporter/zinc transporter [Methylobacterium sp. BE186]